MHRAASLAVVGGATVDGGGGGGEGAGSGAMYSSIGLLLSTVASDPAPSPPPPPPSNTVAPPTTASDAALCMIVSACSRDTMSQAVNQAQYTDVQCAATAAASATPTAAAALQSITPDCSLTTVVDAYSSAKTCTAYLDAYASYCTTLTGCTSCSRRLSEPSEVSYSARMTVGFSDAGKADVFSTSVTQKNVLETFFPESMRTDVALTSDRPGGPTTSRIQVLDCIGAASRSDGSCNFLAAPIYYKVVTSGYCGPCRDASCTDSHGGAYQYVTTQDDCKAAASYLGKKGKTIPPEHVDTNVWASDPPYCTYYPTADVQDSNGPDALWMLGPDNTGECAPKRECLCASSQPLAGKPQESNTAAKVDPALAIGLALGAAGCLLLLWLCAAMCFRYRQRIIQSRGDAAARTVPINAPRPREIEVTVTQPESKPAPPVAIPTTHDVPMGIVMS